MKLFYYPFLVRSKSPNLSERCVYHNYKLFIQIIDELLTCKREYAVKPFCIKNEVWNVWKLWLFRKQNAHDKPSENN